MNRWIALFLVAVVVGLGGCQAAHAIDEGQAAELALRIAAQSRPEIDASNAAPRVLEIRPTSLQAAMQVMHAELGAEDRLAQPVWLVRLSGEWYVGIPAPGLTLTPCHTYYVVLDEWGNELRTSIKQ